MKQWMIGVLIGVGAAAIGIGGAFAYNTVNPVDTTAASTVTGSVQPRDTRPGQDSFGRGQRQGQNGLPGQPGQGNNDDQPNLPGRNDNNNLPGQEGLSRGMGRDYTSPRGSNSSTASGERISADDALSKAQDYISDIDADLQVSSIMEFEDDFLVVVTESDTGRGAMELLVDAYSGDVSREKGAAMMWNLKYGASGMKSIQTETDNTLTLEEARSSAQESLDDKGMDAVLADGYSFYGYYTFTYAIDGKTTGIISVNGLTGKVSYNNWGEFISEKEY